jgi:hypothetical protein
MLQRDGVVMMMMVLVMMVMMMMIPMKPNSMAMMIATIFPLSGKEFPRQIFACRRAFSLYVFSAPQRQRSLSLIPPGS